MTRPIALTVNADGIPEALRREPRWVCWSYVLRDGRWTKVPYQPSGAMAKSDDSSTWTTFAAALAAYQTGRFDGIGFVLGDGRAGVDVDHYVGHVWPLLDELAGYHETSPSGEGFKIFGRSARIGGQIDFNREPPTFTTWAGARFFAVTGHGGGDPLADLTPFLDDWFPAPAIQPTTREGYSLAAETSDDDLLLQAVGSDNGEAFLALWRGGLDAHGGDHSRADQALVNHLAFWCNFDTERIDRLFRQSGLYRDKWDKPSYRRATIGKALR